MNISFAPERADRWRALAVLAAGIALLAAILFVPLLRPWWRTETKLAKLRIQIAETLQTQSRAPAIEDALRAARESASANGNYLPEPSVALGNAALAMRIQGAVAASVSDTDACILGDRLPIKSDAPSPCVEARLKVKLLCGTGSLEKVLRNLETQPPRLRIDRMTLNLESDPAGFGQRPGSNTPISANFEVAGCLLAAPPDDGIRIATP